MRPAVCVSLALVVAAVVAAQEKQTFTGVVTDSMCVIGGHAQMRMGPTDAECTRACVEAHGADFVLDVGKDGYILSNKPLADTFAGQKVKVTGTLNAKTKTIQVDAITAEK